MCVVVACCALVCVCYELRVVFGMVRVCVLFGGSSGDGYGMMRNVCCVWRSVYWSLVARCWRLCVVGYVWCLRWVVFRVLVVMSCGMCVVWGRLYVARCMLPVECCLLCACVGWYGMFAVYCVLYDMRRCACVFDTLVDVVG